MTTKIQKWGNSLAVRIPNEFAENLNLQAGSTVSFKQTEDRIMIIPSRQEYSVEDMLKGISKKNRHKSMWPNDKPRGKEIW